VVGAVDLDTVGTAAGVDRMMREFGPATGHRGSDAAGTGDGGIGGRPGQDGSGRVRRVVVRYRVRPEHAATNEELVGAVYAELVRTGPPGFRYLTMRLDDGVTFLHLAWTDATDGSSPLPGLVAFRRFQDNIADRCDDPPVVSEVSVVGSYRFAEGP
jgi:hypothetical protein